ncbi:preprotein translocase subunit SecE [Candidatus Microgenomates bacterium]|nr:preprotein translocase subunit SecE [Candidatus Microgenomates bacterium]
MFIVKYFTEVKEELSKVVWPKPAQVVKLTLIVFVISLVTGLYLGTLDLGLIKLVTLIIK